MLRNETYTGRRAWAKQRKFEQLIDPEDVGAGSQVRMRWQEKSSGFAPTCGPTRHSCRELFAEVRGLMETPRTIARKPRTSTHEYVLPGALFCAHCGRRMEGAWRPNRGDDTGRKDPVSVRPAGHSLHCTGFGRPPQVAYVREDAVLPALDRWIESLVTAVSLAGAQADRGGGRVGNLRSQNCERPQQAVLDP